jgi:hypothetical protein
VISRVFKPAASLIFDEALIEVNVFVELLYKDHYLFTGRLVENKAIFVQGQIEIIQITAGRKKGPTF